MSMLQRCLGHLSLFSSFLVKLLMQLLPTQITATGDWGEDLQGTAFSGLIPVITEDWKVVSLDLGKTTSAPVSMLSCVCVLGWVGVGGLLALLSQRHYK